MAQNFASGFKSESKKGSTRLLLEITYSSFLTDADFGELAVQYGGDVEKVRSILKRSIPSLTGSVQIDAEHVIDFIAELLEKHKAEVNLKDLIVAPDRDMNNIIEIPFKIDGRDFFVMTNLDYMEQFNNEQDNKISLLISLMDSDMAHIETFPLTATGIVDMVKVASESIN